MRSLQRRKRRKMKSACRSTSNELWASLLKMLKPRICPVTLVTTSFSTPTGWRTKGSLNTQTRPLIAPWPIRSCSSLLRSSMPKWWRSSTSVRSSRASFLTIRGKQHAEDQTTAPGRPPGGERGRPDEKCRLYRTDNGPTPGRGNSSMPLTPRYSTRLRTAVTSMASSGRTAAGRVSQQEGVV